ncbi:MAG: hypothetical protein ACTSW1_10760 [Candidatus Hodarchaeales archaeon]
MDKEINSMARVRTSISLDEDLLHKINEYLENNYQYKDRSHFFEVLARRYFESLEG